MPDKKKYMTIKDFENLNKYSKSERLFQMIRKKNNKLVNLKKKSDENPEEA